jgi:hypothetical protein
VIFAILNSQSYPIPRTHYLHVVKFAKGFEQNGYNFIEIKKIEDILLLTQNSFIYISNHYFVSKSHILFRKILHKKLLESLKKTKATPLFWGFHDIPEIQKHFIDKSHLYLTENFSHDFAKNLEKLNFYEDRRFYKLKYSSCLDDRNSFLSLPSKKEKIIYDFNFIGSRYKTTLLNSINSNRNYKSCILFYPPIQNEIIRVSSYSKSKINLVFNSDENISKGFFTERFPEALSMGNLLIHDSPAIDKGFKSEGVIYTYILQEILDIAKNTTIKRALEISELNYKKWQSTDLSYRKQAIKIINKSKK